MSEAQVGCGIRAKLTKNSATRNGTLSPLHEQRHQIVLIEERFGEECPLLTAGILDFDRELPCNSPFSRPRRTVHDFKKFVWVHARELLGELPRANEMA